MNYSTEWLKRLLDIPVLFRIYTVIVAGLYGLTSLLQPETLIYQVAHADDFSKLVMFGLCVLTVISAIDVTINDLLPNRFVIRKALQERHLINMAITVCFAVQMWTCAKYGVSKYLLPFYGIQVILIPIAAFFDVHKRYCLKNKGCQ